MIKKRNKCDMPVELSMNEIIHKPLMLSLITCWKVFVIIIVVLVYFRCRNVGTMYCFDLRWWPLAAMLLACFPNIEGESHTFNIPRALTRKRCASIATFCILRV